MKRLQSTLPNMVISLFCVTIFSAILLGVLYNATKAPIAQQAAEQQLNAIREVAPPFDNNPEADSKQMDIDGNTFIVYPAMRNGQLAGAAVKAISMNGFAGEITIMVGFDADGKIRDYRVLQHGETPGLGSKMEEWFRDPAGARSILHTDPAIADLSPTKDGGDVDAITAATISSRAFLEAVRNAYTAYRDFTGDPVEAHTGASRQHHNENSTEGHTGASRQHHNHIKQH